MQTFCPAAGIEPDPLVLPLSATEVAKLQKKTDPHLRRALLDIITQHDH